MLNTALSFDSQGLTLAGDGTGLVTISGNVTGRNGGHPLSFVTKSGNSTFVLTGSNSNWTATSVTGGVLRFGSASAIGSGAGGLTVASGAIVGLDSDFDIGSAVSSSSTGIVALNANNTTLTGLGGSSAFLGSLGNFSFTPSGAYAAGAGSTYRLGGGGGTLTLVGVNKLTGANSVLIGSAQTNGLGAVVLNNTQNYTGTTTIAFGTLQLGVANALPTTGTLVMSGGTFNLNNLNQTIGTLSGSSSINLGSASLTIGATSGVYSGVISGSGGNLVKQAQARARFLALTPTPASPRSAAGRWRCPDLLPITSHPARISS